MKSNEELIAILKKLNELPVKSVKGEMDQISLKFDEWQRITNENLGEFQYRSLTGYRSAATGYIGKFENKTDIPYSEYIKMQHLPITRYWARQPNIAKKAREMGKPLDEIDELEQIEELWNNVRVKYDPIKEIENASKKVLDTLTYCSLENIEDQVADVLDSSDNLHYAEQCVDKIYNKSEDVTNLENRLDEAMNQALDRLETVKSSQNLSIDDFMQQLGINSEEVMKYYTNIMQEAEKYLSQRHSIMADEGQAFRLNENNDLEIIDDGKAKSKIARNFFSKTIPDIMDTLKEGTQYSKLANLMYEKTEETMDEEKYDEEYEDEEYYEEGNDEKQIEEINEYENIIQDGAKILYRPETELEKWLNDNSGKSIDELQQEMASNEKTIDKNDKELRSQIALRILKQQKIIADQEAEISKLQSKKEITNEK